jgi:hypothetical protein
MRKFSSPDPFVVMQTINGDVYLLLENAISNFWGLSRRIDESSGSLRRNLGSRLPISRIGCGLIITILLPPPIAN